MIFPPEHQSWCLTLQTTRPWFPIRKVQLDLAGWFWSRLRWFSMDFYVPVLFALFWIKTLLETLILVSPPPFRTQHRIERTEWLIVLLSVQNYLNNQTNLWFPQIDDQWMKELALWLTFYLEPLCGDFFFVCELFQMAKSIVQADVLSSRSWAGRKAGTLWAALTDNPYSA